MKKMFMISHAAALLMMASLPLAGAAVNQVSHTATYDISRIGLGTDTVGGVTYTTVNYRGLYNVGTPGMPSLPVELIRFSVPYNATNFTVTTAPVLSQTRLLGHPVYPLQSPSGFTQPDNGIYQNGEPYPATAWFVDEGMMAGENHVVTVAVSPWTYRHTLGATIPDTLRMAESVSVILSYEVTDSPTLHALIREGASLREEGYVQTCAIVVNPDDVRSNAASASRPTLITLDPNNPGPIDSVADPDTYLIITTPQLLGSMKRLAALKRQKGMRVKVVTYSEAISDSIAVGGDNVGDDDNPIIVGWSDASKLRQYIREYYNHRGTKYVLLAGTDVPNINESDMYFRCLAGDYYSKKDFYPFLAAGRLLCTTTEQIDNYTDKLFRYELNPGRGNSTYLNKALVIEDDVFFPQGESVIDGLGNIGMDVTLAADMESDHEQLNLDPITGNDVVNLVNNNHYGFMGTVCDGAPNHVKVYDNVTDSEYYYLWANDTEKIAPGITDTETGNGLNCLLNKDYPMAFYACSGRTMPYSPVQGYGTGLNFGETFTTGKDYGGPAFIGYTKVPYQISAMVFEGHFGYGLIGRNYNICEAMAIAASQIVPGYDDNESLNYLGDPALRMWTDEPAQFAGVQVTRGNNAITLSGIPTNKTIVAYCDNDGQAGLIETSSSSVTINDVSPNSTVMLYKHNYLPYIAPLIIQNTSISHSQYVIADEVKMGKAVDNNRTQGVVTVSEGIEYEIEASGKITLGAGFKVERGAFFATHKSCYK